MSYEKTTWQTGDIVTEERMNKIEQGIEDNSEYRLKFSDPNHNGNIVISIGKEV